ncbi:MAG: glucan biosynthesis glucosyltransferase H, partial [Edwardsiella sp. (in: enterobacteria)]
DGFMHALLDPLYNALACGMATARHRNHPLIARDRDARVTHALAESPRTLGKAERLTLLSDPVVMARLHQALWADPERYSQWHTAYRQLAPAYRLSTSA